MANEHPEDRLVAYAREELSPEERSRVAAHLESCAGCRAALASHVAITDVLRANPEAAPELDGVRYRAELRRKLEARAGRRTAWAWPNWAPVGATALVATGALFLVARGMPGTSRFDEEPPTFDQIELGSQLDLLQNISVVENLDLLEDLDVVQGLDDDDAPVAS